MAGNANSGGPRGSALPPANRAAAQLLERIARDGLRAVARELGVDHSTLARLISGERRATYDHRAAALARYRIAMSAWDEPIR